jgi:hypothetical protein
MLPVGEFEQAVGKLLTENGWYRNGGWRRKSDARAVGVMPPPLSAGQAVDETIGKERERIAAGRDLH